MSYPYAPPPAPPAQGPGASQYYQPATRGGNVHGRGRGGSGHYNPPRPDYNGASGVAYGYSQPYAANPPVAAFGAAPQHQTFPSQQHWHGEHPHTLQAQQQPAQMAAVTPQYYSQPTFAQPQYPPQPNFSTPAHQPYAVQYPTQQLPQWTAQPPIAPVPYAGNHPRGGYNERGGSRGGAPHMHTEQPSLPSSGPYPQAYPDSRPTPQYHYAPPPAPPPRATSSNPRESHHHSQHSRRGRGGYKDGAIRGRHPHHGGARKPSNTADEVHRPAKFEPPPSGKKKKRKVNTLGLTPGDNSASDDDEGEERRLQDLMGQEVIDIADISKYIAERRSLYPTKSRVEAKKVAELAKKNDHDSEASRLEREADKLRKQLKKVESTIKRKREQQDEGDEMRDSSETDGSDVPEVLSSRPQKNAPPQPPAKKADVSKHCKYFSTGGSCGKKGKCRFVHDSAVREAALKEKEANNGQMTIKQRLVLNDKDQEDLAVLESIQYLREKGLMKSSGVDKASGRKEMSSGPASTPTSQTSTLPAPSSTLPPPPTQSLPQKPPSSTVSNGDISLRYKGWNLAGYGNTGIKSEDLP